jgi:hypothetical protein
MTADEIIQALTTFTPVFPRQALSEAALHREEIIPRLLDSLDYMDENLKTIMADEHCGYNLHFYAIFLLAQFREQRVFPRLVGFLHKTEDELDFIIGDVITEDYNAILCSTYNGDIRPLQEVIENNTCYEFARVAAVEAYAYIVRDGHISRDSMIDYFRHVIRTLKEDDSEGATAMVNAVVDEHIFELMPEVKDLYDMDLVDTFVCGAYDSFVNSIFSYTYDKIDKKIHIDDVVAELEKWACYNSEKPPEPKPVIPPPAPPAPEIKAKKKIGRNDPCPCGSGKKYKKCCLPKGITFREETEKEETAAIPKNSVNSGVNLRGLYDDRKPYNLLTDYPGLDPAVKEGGPKFAEFFSPEAVKIDIPVYKAMYHRAIPVWVRRNQRREDLERIALLLEAFALFTQVCARDGIDSFGAFDEKYMVHYRAAWWILNLRDLLKKYKDKIPKEQYAMLESVSQTLDRMG